MKDLYLASKPEAAKNEKRISRISSVITLILSALLILAALNPPDMIIWLNLFAFGGLEAVSYTHLRHHQFLRGIS